jgi:prepilin-type N-terminal cleavage/methylation domain-containing protein
MDFSKVFRLNSLRRSNAGFTLIELAIVLIVIGLILAAIIKGGDLIIDDAQITNFVSNPVREAQTAAMAYYNRTGTFPNTNSTYGPGPLYNMWKVGIQDVINIRNPYIVGTNILFLGLGVVVVQNSDGTYTNYPVIVIQPIANPNGTSGMAWTTATINYAIRLKTVIDGNQNWSAGAVRFCNGWIASIQTRFISLRTELNSSSLQITNYDGYITNAPATLPWETPYISVNNLTVTPAVALGQLGGTIPLLYFYYQTPY